MRKPNWYEALYHLFWVVVCLYLMAAIWLGK